MSIEWVPSQKNAADVLTRVPDVWVKYCKRVRDSASVVGAVSSQPAGIVGPVTLRDIQTAQLTDDQIQAVIRQLEHDLPIEDAADVLTRVPDVWVKYCKRVRDSASVVGAVSSQPAGIVGPVTLRDIQTAQLTDDQIQAVIRQLEHDLPIEDAADVLTRVPDVWVKYCKRVRDSASVVGAVSSQPAGIVGPVTLRDIQTAQLTDDQIQAVIRQLEHDLPIEELFTKVRSQLVVEDSMLWRSVKLPIEGVVQVPVIAADLVEPILQAAHINSGHASWSTMYQMIRKKCYFPKIAVACREYVSKCGQCTAANPRGGPLAAATRCDIPGRPWQEIVVHTLELGSDGHAEYHCVLMYVDVFTKWIEVIPLRRHDAKSVAAAFTSVCQLWGAPEVVRSDDGTEFRNAIVDSLFKSMGVRVRTGAIRHPPPPPNLKVLLREPTAH